MSSTLNNNFDVNKSAEELGVSQFELILMAATRSREIALRNKLTKNRSAGSPVVEAIKDIEAGKIGKEYLTKAV